ncbi:MAG TPA: acetate--CoA ligase family protein [Beijerinckiaceae bacterium]|jgi:acyl-CoA synthetase (NDP forming)|nr:acetate--CoA ligase family protein [Beijerinckiaceae bacterium]
MNDETKMPIEALLRPRSVAFVGVSSRGGGAGVKMMESAALFGFEGPVWPIHPNAPEIGGYQAFKSLAETPEPPDCVIVAVPAEAVLKVLEEAAAAKVKSALVVSEGFADAGNDEGRARQAELVAFAARANMAIAGPNCMGIASFPHHYAATMADMPATAVAGGVSLVSQSGGLLNAFAELCGNRGLGMNYLISMGNQAVVDLADYIDFLAEDSATSVIALIMEGAKNGRRLRAAIARAAPKKPIVVLKLGRSAVGQAATLAHTGTLAGKHEAFEALFKQNGVSLVDSIDELVETASLFSYAPLPKGDRVALFTVSGGATSLMGDLGDKAGVNFPPIGEVTNKRLQQIIEVDRSFNNPIDTIGMPRLRRGDNMARLLETLNDDDELDVVGLALGMRTEGAESHDALVEDLAKALRAAQNKKPLLVVSFVGGSLTKRWRGYAAQHGVPILDNPEIGMRAIRHLVDYAAYRRGSGERPDIARREAYAVPDLKGGRTLTEAESKIILGKAGLPVTKEALARTPAEAAKLWQDIQAPVALKIQSADIPHKSDVGGVYLGARTAAEVEKAATQVLENSTKACPNATIDGILVQEMVEDGVEFILGMTYDDQFGPLVVLGSGGVMVEIFKDAAVRLPPLSREDVRAMIGELKASKLLEGFRGAPRRDVEALIDCCVRFADFVAATDGKFAAIDLNPVFVCARGKGVRIADALIVTRDSGGEAKNA